MAIDETKPIAITGTLRNWKMITNQEGYVFAAGNIYNDNAERFHDGSYIHTSEVVYGPTPLGYIKTRNSVYYLDPNSPLTEPLTTESEDEE